MEYLNNRCVTRPLVQYLTDLLSIACPLLSSTTNFAKSVAETVIMQKLYTVLLPQDEDFDEWLKFVENFDEGSKNYENTVRQLIYTIESINEEALLKIYANLLRAYKLKLLKKDEHLRLSWILTKIFSSDLMYLKKCYGKRKMAECPELLALERQNLVYKNVVPKFNGVAENNYTITPLGIKMLSCGVDYDNYGKYQESNVK